MICTAKVLAHQTLRCPDCGRQKDITPTYAGYSVRFDCCKSWMVSGHFEKTDNFMVMPAIKLTWTPIRPSVKPPRYTDYSSWEVEPSPAKDGFVIVDEYGETLDDCVYTSPFTARIQLRAMIAEELEAREQHGPDHD